MRTLPTVRQAVDRATCANGQRVWKTNIAMQELTVADKVDAGQVLAVSPTGAVRDAMNYLSWSSSLATPLWRTKTKYTITAKTTAATNSGHIITTTCQRSAKNNSNRFGIATQ